MGRACWIAGLVLIWISVAVITLGAHFQSLSPRFAEFKKEMLTQETGTSGDRFNAAGRMAMDLVFTWQYACISSGFLAGLFTVGVLVIPTVGWWHRTISLMLAWVFGLGCLSGAVLGVEEAMRNFHWEFDTLGVGFLLSAAGLGLGGVGAVWSQLALPLTNRGARLA